MPPDQPIILFKDDEVRPFAGQRLDVFLATVLERSRNHAQALLKHGQVSLTPLTAKAEASYRLRKGDQAGGDADLAAARRLDGDVDAVFQRIDLRP